MKLAYLLSAPGVPLLGPSGASAHARSVVRALREDHDVRCIAVLDEDRRGRVTEIEAELTGVPGWPSWLRRWREMREVWAARRVANRAIEHRDVEGVIERHTLFSDAAWRVGERLGVPWVLEVNAPPLHERARYETPPHLTWAQGWERDVLRAAPAIAAVSEWLVSWLREEIGATNVHLVPNGVAPFVGDRSRGRLRLGVGDERPLVGIVGSGKPWHGVERIAGIAARVGADAVSIGATPVHGTRHAGFLEGQALADVVAALDVGLAPYTSEAPPWLCPLKIFDYRAQGVPVIASDAGDCRRLIGEAGSIATTDDSFAEATQSWIGRRTPPLVRSWRDVSRELAALLR